jgi:hypothetical protein
MKRNHHFKQLIDNIKKTDEMITLHKSIGDMPLIIEQYEFIKAKQISELIDSLVIPPYQSIESISVVKQILNKFYPELPSDLVKQKELREVEDAIS